MEERVKGNIKWFDKNRGYGFIEKNGTDYFFHISQKRDNDEEFLEGDDVEFSIKQTEKRFSAIDVTKIKTGE